MTMEVEPDQPEVADVAEHIGRDSIIDHLTNNDKICFKSQQRGESDLTKQEKTTIATEIYNKSKLNFLVRFGQHLSKPHLDFFEQFTEDHDESYEINLVLREFLESVKKDGQLNVKNRRYEALKQMLRDDSYFSEIEMMKRNPLLYEQLVGQYLTQQEKMERDKIDIDEQATLVKVLMEGIERDDAKLKKKEQEQEEGMMEEEEQDQDQETYSQWGEFAEDRKVLVIKDSKTKQITAEEQELLKEEFVSSMYQNFLDGKDEDFDYDSVDNNDKYDNLEIKEYDEEDKYFDSEEPAIVTDSAEPEESEDELDIFMSAVNQNPAVSQLSRDIANL